VRAALAIRDWAADESIELRVGVNTGEVVLSLGASPEVGLAAAGDAVNTAARLQTAAPRISLSPLSDEDTARLLGELLERSVLAAQTQAELLGERAATRSTPRSSRGCCGNAGASRACPRRFRG
jgi:class 3 adenylate cyclase